MAELEDKIGAVLNNPQLMQQILSMAQSLGQSQQQPQKTEPGGPDPAMVQKIAGIASTAGADQNQKALLNALHPYVHQEKLHRLERAMQAAKMAQLASSFLGNGGLQALTGR